MYCQVSNATNLRNSCAVSLSSVIGDQFAHVQTADAEFVDLNDVEAGASDRQAADDQATEGERANRDRSDGESSDCEAADRLGANCSRADSCRWRASRGQVFFHAFLHMALVRLRLAEVHSGRRAVDSMIDPASTTATVAPCLQEADLLVGRNVPGGRATALR
jgi:hypothetical protein